MHPHRDIVIHKFRFLIAGAGAAVWLVLLSAFILALGPARTHSNTNSTDPQMTSLTDSPNILLGTMTVISDAVERGLDSAHAGIYDAAHTVTDAAARSGAFVAGGGKSMTSSTFHAVSLLLDGVGHTAGFLAKGVGHGFESAGHVATKGVVSVMIIPANTVETISGTIKVDNVLHPGDHDAVPIIDPKSPAVAQAQEALQAPTPAAPQPEEAIWPMHGAVTTEFGVPEWPYQPIHTGIDISDGKRSNVTPIKAFRSGRVIDVERTGGLGNHVVVDHGNGVTSVYGHMASIAVTTGQAVDTTTTLGYEGTTGVSTGPHLHFEIRIEGQVANPRAFISGQP